MLDHHDALVPPPSRVLVAGPSGIGKTTLARAIEWRLGLPHTEIDALFHGPNWTPKPDFVERVDEFTSAPTWVTEWQYTTQLGDLLESRADTVVWLDLPIRVHMPRLILRTLRRRIRREHLWNGNVEPPLRTIFTDPEHIIRWGWTSRAKIRRRVIAAEQRFSSLRVVRLRSQRQANEWVRAVSMLTSR